MSPSRDDPRAAASVVAGAVALSAVLVVVRASILGLGEAFADRPFFVVTRALVGAGNDLLVVAVCTLVVLGVLKVTRSRRGRHVIVGVASAGALGLLLAALVNVKAVALLGGPINYAWLYYADFLGASQARHTVLHDVTWEHVAIAAVAAGAFGGLTVLLRPLAYRLMQTRWAFVGLGAVAVYLVLSGWYLRNQSVWDPPKLANPVVALLASGLIESPSPIFTMDTPVGPDDFLSVRERAPEGGPEAGSPRAVRNVVLFVMESVAAQYTEPYGGAHAVTPVLSAQRDRSRTFRNVYSHVPASSKAIIAILGSRYPRISYLTATQEHPDVPMATLSEALGRRGYRTGFFFSADTRYQGIEDFLEHRAFDLVQDHRTRPCDRSPYTNDTSPFADGSDDGCTVTAFLEWLGQAPDEPFFSVVWTMMTHYPYFQPSEAVAYDMSGRSEWEAEHFNRYLNALRHGDAALGTLLAGLETRGLSDSTLVVVVGDHGEAFGQHDQFGHGSSIYEENVHVPFVLINPSLFSGEDDDRVGGLIDIAPTVTDLLGLAPEADWQGTSLVGEATRPRTYFFSTWKENSFGYREGDFKYIYNASRDSVEAYDLAADPGERRNVIDELPGERQRVVERVAAWVQYQRAEWAEVTTR